MDTGTSEANNELGALSQQITAVVERVSPSIVAIDARPRVRTSGVIWRPGILVSTNHTIKRDEEITVTLHGGQQVGATVVGRDGGTDLAVLRLENTTEAMASAQFADAATLRVGNLVLAVGRTHPERGVSAGLGIVGVLGDKWRTWRGGEIDHLINPEVAIFIGFSGGALVNVEGQVIGINTTGLSRGTGLTIPVSTVDRVVDQLLQHGRVARPYLGVGMQPVALPDRLREKFHLSAPTGLILLSVEADSPADKAGMTIGDILLAFEGVTTSNTDDVQAMLGAKEVGTMVKAKLLRGGETVDVQVTLGERPTRNR